ncbi:MAG: glycosyltransferase family 2 protein [Burkholderiales bacterium]
MTKWLSILLPVYNVEAYLPDCFRSISTQELSGVEVIAVDDRSTDGSFEALKRIAADMKLDVRLLRHDQNRGVSAARNTLVDAATGDYLWFLDPDDIFADDAIRQLKRIIELHSPDLILCDLKRWRPDVARHSERENHLPSFGGPSGVLMDDGELLFKGLYQKGRLHNGSKISKRNLWTPALRFPEGRCFEDVVVMPKVAFRAKNYFYQDSAWIHYRQRLGSITATPTLKKIEDMSISTSGALDQWLGRYPKMSAASRSAFYGYCVKIYNKAIKDLSKINQLRPEVLFIHRRHFYENTKTGKYRLMFILLWSGNVTGLRKLLKVFRYL